ncbi:MAG TPA: hypothetical protein VK807_23380 [Gemmatimonadaceae bacterium]|nr:hypothetical protein [Gemmatimonadaceae bacterium]
MRTSQGRQGRVRAVDWMIRQCLVSFPEVPHLQAVKFDELSIVEEPEHGSAPTKA